MDGMQPQSYFAQYPRFEFNPDEALLTNFRKLAAEEGWNPRRSRYRTEYKRFCQMEFDQYFHGFVGEAGAAPWQALLRELGVRATDIPGSVTKCKAVSIFASADSCPRS